MATAPTAVASDPIQYEVNDQIATIWLNRPEVKNCVNWELLHHNHKQSKRRYLYTRGLIFPLVVGKTSSTTRGSAH